MRSKDADGQRVSLDCDGIGDDIGNRSLRGFPAGTIVVSSSIGDAWEEAATDPDPHKDLNYELQPLTLIKLDQQRHEMYMILPGEEDHLHDEEFMLADPGSICRLDECR